MAVDPDAWTCPVCGDTTRGTRRARRGAQTTHAGRHHLDAEGRAARDAEEHAEFLADREERRMRARRDRDGR